MYQKSTSKHREVTFQNQPLTLTVLTDPKVLLCLCGHVNYIQPWRPEISITLETTDSLSLGCRPSKAETRTQTLPL